MHSRMFLWIIHFVGLNCVECNCIETIFKFTAVFLALALQFPKLMHVPSILFSKYCKNKQTNKQNSCPTKINLQKGWGTAAKTLSLPGFKSSNQELAPRSEGTPHPRTLFTDKITSDNVLSLVVHMQAQSPVSS